MISAVAIRDNPDLRDKPVAVGDMHMISTASYAARKFGVRSAMPGSEHCYTLLYAE